MAKKKATNKPTGATAGTTTKKKGKKGDLPGQKVMPHGPKKVPELETKGGVYASKVAALQRAKDDLTTAEGAMFDAIDKKRGMKTYTVAGYTFAVRQGAKKLSITKAKG